MTMTKKQAIKYHINTMHDIDLICLISEINFYDGGYNAFYNMDEFNDIYCNVPPVQIADEVTGTDFSADDEYLYYNEVGNLCSCDKMTVADMIRTDFTTDLINDFMKGRYYEQVLNCDNELFDIITADDNAIFDDECHEILK